jgi:thiol-disulfide isomerase/thioredoxin
MDGFVKIKIKSWHFVVAILLFTILLIMLERPGIEKNTGNGSSDYLVALDSDALFADPIMEDSYILFHTEDSGFCDRMKYNFNRFAKNKQGNAGFFTVDLNKYPEHYTKFNISGVPSILVFKNGKEVKRILGVVPEYNLEKIYHIINN